MNRRDLLKTFLAAPAVIRSGVLMPVVPLVVARRGEIADEFGHRGWIDVGHYTGQRLDDCIMGRMSIGIEEGHGDRSAMAVVKAINGQAYVFNLHPMEPQTVTWRLA